MGHVNHGKTTLIDYLRKSNIAEHEDGGITQKIGAFGINCHGKRITFIDTPGHETFTNIRQRGASVADLIILVVSAAEGVEKQTM
jgi:translation initiation factor IF-2